MDKFIQWHRPGLPGEDLTWIVRIGMEQQQTHTHTQKNSNPLEWFFLLSWRISHRICPWRCYSHMGFYLWNLLFNCITKSYSSTNCSHSIQLKQCNVPNTIAMFKLCQVHIRTFTHTQRETESHLQKEKKERNTHTHTDTCTHCKCIHLLKCN